MWKWLIKDSRKNQITVTARTASEARRRYLGMFGSEGQKVRDLVVERQGPVESPRILKLDHLAKVGFPDGPTGPTSNRVPRPPAKKQGQERNAPCACGSGRKFKNCCMRNQGATGAGKEVTS